ncbi:MAG: hypothetical protein Q7R32_13925 [Dehalococcoidia bacterium]|nr:hypothetical protein [Dehalococcoidia bacterium]
MTADLPIREFAFVDKERLEDFLSPLLGGMPFQQRETSEEDGARTTAGLDVKLASVQRIGDKQRASWEEIRNATPASLFDVLVQELRQRGAIQELTAFDAEIWEQLAEGEFVLAPCQVQFSALERLFDMFQTYSQMMAILSPQDVAQTDVKRMLDYLNLLSEQQDSVNIRCIPSGGPSQRHIFVGSLDKRHVRVSKTTLEGKFQVFGRVQHKLARSESFDLFSLMPPGLRLSREQLRDLLGRFSDTPAVLGAAPRMEDLRVSYPAIVVTMVAVFR